MDSTFKTDRETDAATPPAQHGDDRSWYLVSLKPGGLARAQQNLFRQGIESFCPRRRRTERLRGRMVTGLRPLFPGYLFISVAHHAVNWRSVNATYGIVKVVCLEPGRPSRVPTAVIDALVAGDASLNGERAAHDIFSPGDDVRVAAGPFADFVARVEAMSDKDRILVLLDMMGRTVRTTLCVVDLERT